MCYNITLSEVERFALKDNLNVIRFYDREKE